MSDWEHEFRVLGALLDGIVPRVRHALEHGVEDGALAALGVDLEAAARFAIEADSYQRPDDYCLAHSPLSAPEVATFLDLLFARRPDARKGYLARLAAFHGRGRS